MKLAVCYRGHLRTISKSFENQKQHLFKDHDVDFFCHTWNIYDEEIDFMKEVVKPKRLLVEDIKMMEKNPYNSMTVSNLCVDQNFDRWHERTLVLSHELEKVKPLCCKRADRRV